MYEHRRLMHCGPQLLLASVREHFWTIGGRNLAKAVVRGCTICFKANPKQITPIMGNLPESRLRPSAPFEISGVDYAGPFLIKSRRGRGGSITKCWISLFVCFITRAIHIELVSSLNSETFIMALRRFAVRRGKPKVVYSDNGTTFVGAKKLLATFFKENERVISDQAINDGINWKFIPACSPHFGGIWEAGVKSVKFHLKRVINNASLTFEEFYTLLTQVEAILNSRPLFPMSTDPSDLSPITPAHLLVGRSLTTIPHPDVRNWPENCMRRFQRIQQLAQHFWERWSKEYIGELQQRCKWKQSQGHLQADSLVIVKEDNQPPRYWKVGHVLQLHPGKDNISRVATIKTSSGVIKRAFPKICPLPISDI